MIHLPFLFQLRETQLTKSISKIIFNRHWISLFFAVIFLPGIILAQTPIASYPLNGNANDISGNGLNGSIVGTLSPTTDRFGNANSAMQFDGNAANRIEIADNALLRPTSISLMAWVKLNNQSSIQSIIDKPLSTCTNDSWHFATEGSNYSGWVNTGALGCGDLIQMTTPNIVGVWRHVAFVVDAVADVRKLYVNGIEVANSPYSNTILYDGNPVFIGGCLENNAPNFAMNGAIDEAKIFGSALNQAQIQAQFEAGNPTPVAATPIVHYQLNGNANDAGTNNLNGTIIGTITPVADRNGNINSAMQFDGNAANRIEIADNTLLRPGSITLMAWVKINNQTGLSAFIDKALSPCINDSWHFGTEGGNYSTWISPSTSCGDLVQITSPLTVGTWKHIAYTMDAASDLITMYVDGIAIGTKNFTGSLTYDANPVILGAALENNAPNFGLNGVLDDVKIFNSALTPGQIRLEAEAASLPQFVAYFPLDGNANDLSGNNLNGIITGTVTPVNDRFGNTNSAGSFNGASRIDVADNPLLRSPNVTLSAWVFSPTPIAGTQIIAAKNLCSGPLESYTIFHFNGQLVAGWSDGNPSEIITAPGLTPGIWHQVVFTFDDVNNIAVLYVDGAVVGSKSTNMSLLYDNSSFSIGSELENCVHMFPLTATIDELKIYNTALTAAQILAEFNNVVANSFVFTGNGNWSNPANWQNGNVPPASLPALASITVAGNCTLDVNQTIELNGQITVNPGQVFLIPTTSTFSLSGKLTNNGTTLWNSTGQIFISTGGAESIVGTGLITMNAAEIVLSTKIDITGSGAMTLTANTRIGISFSTIQVTDGNLTLLANQNSTATGDFIGIRIEGSGLGTRGTGNIIMNGKGLTDFSGSQQGVLITANSIVESTLATGGGRIEITGAGGAGITSGNIGIFLNSSTIRTTSGDIIMNGSAIGQGVQNIGLVIQAASRVESFGSGQILLKGTGSANGTDLNIGCLISSLNTIINSPTGKISIEGTGFGTGNNNVGVFLTNSAILQATGTAKIKIKGLGSTSGNIGGIGLAVGSGASITSSADSLLVVGKGGGINNGQGLQISTQGFISATNQAKIAVYANGSNTGTDNNNGIFIDGLNSGITSASSPIFIQAIAGGSTVQNMGLRISNKGFVKTSAGGKIKIVASGSSGGTVNCVGIALLSTGFIQSAGDSLDIQAFGNGNGSANAGINMSGASSISSTNGVLQIRANGSTNGTRGNHGILVAESGTKISASQGKLLVSGTGGGSGGSNSGILLNTASIEATGSTELIMQGTGGGAAADSIFNTGINLSFNAFIKTGNLPATINALAGAGNSAGFRQSPTNFGTLDNGSALLTITATGSGTEPDIAFSGAQNRIGGGVTGTGPIQINANSYDGGNVVSNGGSLIIKPRTPSTTIGLGEGTGILQLSNQELAGFSNLISNVTIGDATSGTGPVQIKNATLTRPATVVGGSVGVSGLNSGSNSVNLIARTGNVSDLDDTGADITSAGTIGLQYPNGALAPGNSPGLFAVSGAYSHSGALNIEVGGASAGTGFDQLNVSGAVTISPGATLNTSLINGFTPTPGQTFDVVLGASLSGTFQNTNLPGGWSVSYQADKVRLTAPSASFTPTISAAGLTTFCQGGNVELQASNGAGFSHKWFRNGVEIEGQTSANLTATLSGSYKAEVTNGSSQTAQTNEITITVNPIPATPTISAGGPTTFCAGGSVQLTSAAASGNLWSNGETTQTITVSSSGSFSVKTIALGCTSPNSNATSVTVNPVPATPTISAGGPTTFCAGGSVQLTSAAASGNLWSNGETTQTITVSSSGSFSVKTIALGCTSPNSNATSVTVNPVPATPTISAGGPTTFCAGGSVQLTSAAASGNLWSNGETTQTITVSSSGSFSVKTIALGCTSPNSNATSVTVNPVPATPTVSAGGPTTFCAGGSVQLTSAAASGNLWSNGETTQTITVSSSGSFSVKTIALGCTSPNSNATSVTVNPVPATPTITAGGPTTFCADGSVQLTSAAASGNLWSNGETTQTITVSSSGSFTVKTIALGCTSPNSNATSVTVNPVPAVLASSDVSILSGQSTTLTATGAVTYIWSPLQAISPANGVGASVSVNPIQTTLYSVTGTNANNCSNTAQVLVTVNVGGQVANPVITPGTGTFTSSQFVTITSATPEAIILYTTNGSNPLAGDINTKIYTGPFGLACNTVIKAIATKNGLENSGVSTVTLTISATKPPTPGPIAGIKWGVCSTEVRTYSVNPVANATSYKWIAPANSTIISGQGSTSVQLQFGTGFTSGVLYVQAVNCLGTNSAQAIALNRTFLSPVSISGPTFEVCAGSTQSYSCPLVEGASGYEWSGPAGSVINSGQGTNTVSITLPTPFASGLLGVKAVSACFQSSVRAISLRSIPSTPTAITGLNAGICVGSEQTFSCPLSTTGATFYNWTVPSGATLNAGQGTNSVTVSFSSGFSSGNLTVQAGNTCGSYAPRNLYVASTPTLPGLISGQSTGICSGGSITYSIAPIPGAISYNWTIPLNCSITSNTGTAITMQVPSGFTTGSISVSATNACGTGRIRSLSLLGVAQTPGLITGKTSNLCAGGIFNYSIAAVPGALSYTWTPPAGCSIVSNTGTSISLSIPSNFQEGTISVNAVGSCGNSAQRKLALTGLPATPGAISGQASNLCAGATITYKIAQMEGSTGYLWNIPAGTSLVSNQGNSITITVPPNFVSDTLSVKNLGVCGQSVARKLLISGFPAVPAAVTGQTTNLCGGGTFNYSILPVSGADLYTWSVPSSCSITANTGTSISVSVPANFVSGMLSVSASNTCGTGAIRKVSMNRLPATPSVITGSNANCPSGINLNYSVLNTSGLTYSWTVPTGANIISGQGTNAINSNWGVNAGNVTVRASNTCGISGARSLVVGLLACKENVADLQENKASASVFPNPGRGEFNLSVSGLLEDKVSVRVFNLQGKLVKEFQEIDAQYPQTIDLKNQAAGMYWIHLSGKGFDQKIRLVKE